MEPIPPGRDLWDRSRSASQFSANGSLTPDNNRLVSNVIAFSGGDGIRVSAGVGNVFIENRIYSNEGDFGNLGIDLGGDGVTANDADELDGWQNYPVLTSAISGGNNTPITGSLNSSANTNFRIEFFTTAIADASGHGEADLFIGAIDVLTDALGEAIFTANLPIAVSAGHFMTATATRLIDHDNDPGTPLELAGTSEFAANIMIAANNSPVANGDSVIIDEDAVFNGSLDSLASDPDGDDLLFSLETNAGNGMVTVDPNGAYTYTPDENFNGSDSFVYRVSDDDLSATATINITVNPVGDVAVIGGQLTRTTDEDTASETGSLTITDPDAGEDAFQVQTGTAGRMAHLIWTLRATGLTRWILSACNR